jgi:transketolase C-terminal domain/subunit
MEKIGVHDRFGESAGSEEMLEMMGLKSHHISDAVKKVIARKA